MTNAEYKTALDAEKVKVEELTAKLEVAEAKGIAIDSDYQAAKLHIEELEKALDADGSVAKDLETAKARIVELEEELAEAKGEEVIDPTLVQVTLSTRYAGKLPGDTVQVSKSEAGKLKSNGWAV